MQKTLKTRLKILKIPARIRKILKNPKNQKNQKNPRIQKIPEKRKKLSQRIWTKIPKKRKVRRRMLMHCLQVLMRKMMYQPMERLSQKEKPLNPRKKQRRKTEKRTKRETKKKRREEIKTRKRKKRRSLASHPLVHVPGLDLKVKVVAPKGKAEVEHPRRNPGRSAAGPDPLVARQPAAVDLLHLELVEEVDLDLRDPEPVDHIPGIEYYRRGLNDIEIK